jgi:hypothetical protein
MRVADARKAHVVQTPVEPRPGVDLHSVPMTNNEAPLPWMVEGCLAAVERLRVETQRGDADAKDTFFPSFEALNWAASIDLFLFENGAAVENDLLTGVRFARNRVHHQWARRSSEPIALEYHASLWPRARRGSSGLLLASGGIGWVQTSSRLGHLESHRRCLARSSTRTISPESRPRRL